MFYIWNIEANQKEREWKKATFNVIGIYIVIFGLLNLLGTFLFLFGLVSKSVYSKQVEMVTNNCPIININREHQFSKATWIGKYLPSVWRRHTLVSLLTHSSTQSSIHLSPSLSLFLSLSLICAFYCVRFPFPSDRLYNSVAFLIATNSTMSPLLLFIIATPTFLLHWTRSNRESQKKENVWDWRQIDFIQFCHLGRVYILTKRSQMKRTFLSNWHRYVFA